MAVADGGLVIVGGTGVDVGETVADAIASCVGGGTGVVGLAVADRAGPGEGGSGAAVKEAVGVGNADTGVSVGNADSEPETIEVDSGVGVGPNEERQAATRVPTAARPRLTNRRREMLPHAVISR